MKKTVIIIGIIALIPFAVLRAQTEDDIKWVLPVFVWNKYYGALHLTGFNTKAHKIYNSIFPAKEHTIGSNELNI